ncbi:MAG: hypothetical protein ACM34H_04755 [Deltaproteobacteria bacterium]
MIKRPSSKELHDKLRKAREIIDDGSIYLVEDEPIIADALDLGYDIAGISGVLKRLFNEISQKDYAGTRPPQKSYKNPILDCELYAFSWASRHFGCRVYLKFALKGEFFWLISLH